MQNAKSGVGNDKSEFQIPHLVLEHIIQDAGTSGSEGGRPERGKLKTLYWLAIIDLTGDNRYPCAYDNVWHSRRSPP